ncbi:MAG: hypothetical protein GY729_17620, partial [Desulfobacteraceae bacterium]|nr:hypothetical protein [Desulfobacteraceae bacterium]
MNHLLKKLLKEYETQGVELQLKAKFVLLMILCAIGIIILSIIYNVCLTGLRSILLYPQSIGLGVMLISFLLLIKGYYQITIHLIFIICFSVAWTVLFGEAANSLLIKMDTIVYITGILAATPLMLFNNRKPMVVYFLINFLIFAGFVYHIHLTTDISNSELLDYFFDNA